MKGLLRVGLTLAAVMLAPPPAPAADADAMLQACERQCSEAWVACVSKCRPTDDACTSECDAASERCSEPCVEAAEKEVERTPLGRSDPQ